jgi:hypothetical protein
MEEAMKKDKNLEPELRLSYIKKIKKIQRSGNFSQFSSIEQLLGEIEMKEGPLIKRKKRRLLN